MDNRWGDYHWPPTPALIGPEVRRLAYRETMPGTLQPGDPSTKTPIDTVSCSFGPQFWKLGPLPGIITNDTVLNERMFDPRVGVTFHGKMYAWHPYQFSWRWGVENDPGHQGYHGLKEEVHDEYIRLGKMSQGWTTIERQVEEGGTYYCLFTGVVAPVDGRYAVEQGHIRPASIRINGVLIDTTAQSVLLKAGLNTLVLWYARPCVTYFALRKPGDQAILQHERGRELNGKSLAMKWYGDTSLLPFDTRFAEVRPEGWYSFTSAPGMKRMHLVAHGMVEVFVGGERVRATKGDVRNDGAAQYTVDLVKAVPKPVEVTMRIEQKRGYYGGAALPEPIRLECEKGLFEAGDWSRNGGLYAYSGGAWYRKSVRLSSDETKQKVELNLGSVASTAEVRINGNKAGLRVAPPWVYDISKYVQEGDNTIEVLVYNTAANHYTSIPTRYRGPITSGILGPVTVNFTGTVVLKDQ